MYKIDLDVINIVQQCNPKFSGSLLLVFYTVKVSYALL